ncbi:ATP synthase delta chain, chloroplastic-like protein [Drosera capensis]
MKSGKLTFDLNSSLSNLSAAGRDCAKATVPIGYCSRLVMLDFGHFNNFVSLDRTYDGRQNVCPELGFPRETRSPFTYNSVDLPIAIQITTTTHSSSTNLYPITPLCVPQPLSHSLSASLPQSSPSQSPTLSPFQSHNDSTPALAGGIPNPTIPSLDKTLLIITTIGPTPTLLFLLLRRPFSSLRLLLPSSFSTRVVLDSRARRGGCGPLRAAGGDSAAASYATVLLELAESGNSLDATCEDIGKVEKLFSDEQVLEFFLDPTLDAEQKLALIDEIATSSGLQEGTDRGFPQGFEQVYDDLTGTEVAVVSSVVELENQHLAQIAKGIQQLTGAKNIRVKTVIDYSLLAGLTIKYGKTGSNFIDISVKKQLDAIAANLESGDLQFAI